MDHEALDGYNVIEPIEVKWGEMDAFGHLNNVVHFRYFEQARIAYMEELGYEEMDFDESVGPILAHVETDYHQPVKYPDTVYLGTKVTNIGQSKMEMEYTMVSDSTKEKTASGECVIVIYNFATEKPTAMPEPMREKIEKFEETEF